MIKLLFCRQLYAIFTFLFAPFFVFSQDLIIVEVQVRKETPSQSYIKIYNQNTKEKDISGFRLVKKSSTGREYSIRVFPNESFISGNGYFKWANSRDDYHFLVNADAKSTAEISSDNSVALISKDGNVIDSLAWGKGKNQFISKNPFPFNPQEKELIKRVKESGIYKNTKDNSVDFYIFPERNVLKTNPQEHVSNLKKETELPIKKGVSIAVFLSVLFLILKLNLKKSFE